LKKGKKTVNETSFSETSNQENSPGKETEMVIVQESGKDLSNQQEVVHLTREQDGHLVQQTVLEIHPQFTEEFQYFIMATEEPKVTTVLESETNNESFEKNTETIASGSDDSKGTNCFALN
jgi:hypothetical protein